MIVVLLAMALASFAQRPEGWKVRLDRPGFLPSEPTFITLAPGWHITTGPPMIAYETASVARGNFTLESELMLFPGGPNEGYGLFLAGKSLESNELSYTAFQLRRDGRFSIWIRTGATTRDIVPWTPHPSIVPHTGGVEPVKNVVVVDARTDEIAFLVNGRPVHVARRSTLVVDGNYGFRVHENMNVHPTKLTLR